MPLAVRANRKPEQCLDKLLGVGGLGRERVRTSRKIACAGFIIVKPQEPDPVDHQPRIGRDLRIDHAVQSVGIRRSALHCDARGESSPAGGAGISRSALCIVGLPGEQQGIDALVMIGGREVGPISRRNRALVGGGQISRRPGLSRHRLRLRSPSRCRQRLGQPCAPIAGAWLVAAEEGDDRRPIFAGAHLGFGRLAQPGVVGPVGIGDQEARIIGKRIAIAGAQPPPVGKCIVDVGLRHSWGRVSGHILVLGNDRARRRGDQYKQESELSHAGHRAGSVLIKR